MTVRYSLIATQFAAIDGERFSHHTQCRPSPLCSLKPYLPWSVPFSKEIPHSTTSEDYQAVAIVRSPGRSRAVLKILDTYKRTGPSKINGSSSLSGKVDLWDWKHSRPQQFDAHAAEHGSLEGFQSVELAFGLATASRFGDGVHDGVDVAA